MKVTIDAAMQHCCDAINESNVPGLRRRASYSSGGISVEYELPLSRGSTVSLHVDLVSTTVKQVPTLQGRVQISNATQLSVEVAEIFVVLYQQVLRLAATLQDYLDSIEMIA